MWRLPNHLYGVRKRGLNEIKNQKSHQIVAGIEATAGSERS